MVAYSLTPLWGSYQFLPSSLLVAIGQSFLALSGVVFFGILHLKPQDALTFGAALQTARLMGGEVGSAFQATFVRVREQAASNLIGQHVQAGDPQVIERMRAYGAATTRVIDPVSAYARGELVLGNAVRAAATTQAVIDGFAMVGLLTAVALLVVVSRRAARWVRHPQSRCFEYVSRLRHDSIMANRCRGVRCRSARRLPSGSQLSRTRPALRDRVSADVIGRFG